MRDLVPGYEPIGVLGRDGGPIQYRAGLVRGEGIQLDLVGGGDDRHLRAQPFPEANAETSRHGVHVAEQPFHLLGPLHTDRLAGKCPGQDIQFPKQRRGQGGEAAHNATSTALGRTGIIGAQGSAMPAHRQTMPGMPAGGLQERPGVDGGVGVGLGLNAD